MTKEDAQKILPLIQAHAEGKPIQMRNQSSGLWFDVTEPDFICKADLYRIKPEPEPVVMVPLEVTDFPPGSVIRRPIWPDGGYSSPTHVTREGPYFGSKWNPAYAWDILYQNGYLIKRPGEDWQPCCKPAIPSPSTP